MLKAILNSGPVQTALGVAISGYMHLVKLTTRWERRGLEHAQSVWDRDGGAILCIWHSRILMAVMTWPKGAQPASVLISRSREGDVMAHAAHGHGIGVVRGSSMNQRKKDKQKGSLSDFRDMARRAKAGGCMALTPDGPRGPRMRAGAGPAKLARATGVPILPAAWSTRRAIVFDSWDRFVLPLPFGRGIIVYGEPVLIPAGSDADVIEAGRVLMEDRLNAVTNEADLACGRAITEPAEPAP